MADIVSPIAIENRIHLVRGKKVMFDSDLSALYEVETKQLKRAVRRNIDRFPEDFMFELTKDELEILRRQIGTSSWGGERYKPFAFTEQGVAMLSSVLNSKRAIQVNIQIMRAFVKLRTIISENKDLKKVIQHIERRLDVHDRQIQIAFAALKSILQPPPMLTKKHYSPDDEKKMGFGKGKK